MKKLLLLIPFLAFILIQVASAQTCDNTTAYSDWTCINGTSMYQEDETLGFYYTSGQACMLDASEQYFCYESSFQQCLGVGSFCDSAGSYVCDYDRDDEEFGWIESSNTELVEVLCDASANCTGAGIALDPITTSVAFSLCCAQDTDCVYSYNNGTIMECKTGDLVNGYTLANVDNWGLNADSDEVCYLGTWYDCDFNEGIFCADPDGSYTAADVCANGGSWRTAPNGETGANGEYFVKHATECCGDDANENFITSSDDDTYACCDNRDSNELALSGSECVVNTTCWNITSSSVYCDNDPVVVVTDPDGVSNVDTWVEISLNVDDLFRRYLTLACYIDSDSSGYDVEQQCVFQGNGGSGPQVYDLTGRNCTGLANLSEGTHYIWCNVSSTDDYGVDYSGSFSVNHAPILSDVNCSHEGLVVNNTDDVNMTARFNDTGYVELLVAPTSSFTDCDINTSTGCLCNGENLQQPGGGCTIDTSSLSGRVDYYAKVCDDEGRCSTDAGPSGLYTGYFYVNVPPVMVGVVDDNSSAAEPTDEGFFTTFTVTATDANTAPSADTYQLKVYSSCADIDECSESDDNMMCSSPFVSSGATTSCNWNTTGQTEESINWWAFVCDNNGLCSPSTCSGSEPSCKAPLHVNHRPYATSVTVTPSSPSTTSTLNCTYTFNDADNEGTSGTDSGDYESVSSAHYLWQVNQSGTWTTLSQNSKTLTSTYFDLDDEIRCSVKVADNHGYTDDAFVYSSSVTISGNHVPVLITVLDNSDNTSSRILEGSDVTFSVNWTDVDGDSGRIFICTSSSITSSGCQATTYCSSSFGSSPSSCSYTTKSTENPSNTYYYTVCDDSGECAPVQSSTFFVNRAPIVDDVDIVSDIVDFTTSANLNCTVDYDLTDPDNEPVNITYAWYVNRSGTVYQYEAPDQEIVTHGNTQNGDQWRCGVTPNDPYMDGTEVYSDWKLITNDDGSGGHAPWLVSYSDDSDDSVVSVGDYINFTIVWDDAAANEEVSIYVCNSTAIDRTGCFQKIFNETRWTSTKNMTLSYKIETDDYNTSYYWIMVCDDTGGKVGGDWLCSDFNTLDPNEPMGNFTVNHPPTLSSLQLTSASGSLIYADDDENIICTASGASDLEGHPLSFQYEWFVSRSGTFVSYMNTTNATLAHGNTLDNDVWYCRARPYDSYSYGTWHSSNTLRIGQTVYGSPSILEANITDKTLNEGEAMLVNVLWSDSDSNSVRLYACNSTDFNPTGCLEQEIIKTTYTSSNPIATSHTVTSLDYFSTVYLAVCDSDLMCSNLYDIDVSINHKPVVQGIAVTSDNNFADNANLNCTLNNSYDPDGDSYNITYTWQKSTSGSWATFLSSPSPVLSHGWTSQGDSWRCQAQSFDGQMNGTKITSAPVEIASAITGGSTPTLQTLYSDSTPLLPSNVGSSVNFYFEFDDSDSTEFWFYVCNSSYIFPTGCMDHPLVQQHITGFSGSEFTISSLLTASYTVEEELGTNTTYYGMICDSNWQCSNMMSNELLVNHRPEAVNVTINPTSPDSADTLSCNYTYVPNDAGLTDILDDAIVNWYEQENSQGSYALVSSDSPTYTGSIRNDRVHCEVLVEDVYSLADTSYRPSTSVLIENSPPVTSVSISPAYPAVDKALTCVNSTSDPDSDSFTTSVKWYMNGIWIDHIDQPVLGSSWTQNGQNWTCEITAQDPYESSIANYTVTIGSQAPSGGNESQSETPYINSQYVDPAYVGEGQDVTFYVNWSDPDVNESGYMYVCDNPSITYNNGCGNGIMYCYSPYPTGHTTDMVMDCSYTVGSGSLSYTYYVAVCDSTNLCSNVSSGTFSINQRPLVNISVSPSTAYADSNLTCGYTFTDNDGNSENISLREVNWTRGSTLLYQGEVLTPGSFSRGDVLTCSARGADVYGLYSDPVEEDITILNSPPQFSAIYTLTEGTSFIANFSLINTHDADSDTVYYRHKCSASDSFTAYSTSTTFSCVYSNVTDVVVTIEANDSYEVTTQYVALSLNGTLPNATILSPVSGNYSDEILVEVLVTDPDSSAVTLYLYYQKSGSSEVYLGSVSDTISGSGTLEYTWDITGLQQNTDYRLSVVPSDNTNNGTKVTSSWFRVANCKTNYNPLSDWIINGQVFCINKVINPVGEVYITENASVTFRGSTINVNTFIEGGAHGSFEDTTFNQATFVSDSKIDVDLTGIREGLTPMSFNLTSPDTDLKFIDSTFDRIDVKARGVSDTDLTNAKISKLILVAENSARLNVSGLVPGVVTSTVSSSNSGYSVTLSGTTLESIDFESGSNSSIADSTLSKITFNGVNSLYLDDVVVSSLNFTPSSTTSISGTANFPSTYTLGTGASITRTFADEVRDQSSGTLVTSTPYSWIGSSYSYTGTITDKIYQTAVFDSSNPTYAMLMNSLNVKTITPVIDNYGGILYVDTSGGFSGSSSPLILKGGGGGGGSYGGSSIVEAPEDEEQQTESPPEVPDEGTDDIYGAFHITGAGEGVDEEDSSEGLSDITGAVIVEPESKRNFSILSLVLLMIFIIAGLLFYNYREPEEEVSDEEEELQAFEQYFKHQKMIDEADEPSQIDLDETAAYLDSYIGHCVAQGYSKDAIRAKLTSSGWPEHLFNEKLNAHDTQEKDDSLDDLRDMIR